MHYLRFRTVLFGTSLYLLASCVSCALISPGNTGEGKAAEVLITSENSDTESPERIYFREELAMAREEIKTDLREMILEEILPEIWTEHHHDKEMRDAKNKTSQSAKERIYIGRVEWVTFKDPDFSLQARIDTGAKTCSIHAENIKELQINGEPFVQFETVDDENNKHTMVRRVVARTKVKNSSGKTSLRYVIRLSLRIGNDLHDVNVNLNDRESMRYSFLIGRNLLLGNYLVDVSESHLLGDKK